jgi:hypothetical protein
LASDEIVGRGGEDEEPFDKLTPAMLCLAQDVRGKFPTKVGRQSGATLADGDCGKETQTRSEFGA